MASKCRKFVPNMFNKSKCQACFGSKEAHSAAALENNKVTRKVSKCGYLFVAPNFDFTNPLDRTRRWQRRFFRLYDDGELTFCVDENLDTVPQGAVDMNKCTDILEAEVLTSHCNSLAIVTPDKTEYIKADSKEEIQWWHDVLIKFPSNLKALKTRRKPNYVISNNKENVKPSENEENAKKPPPSPAKSEAGSPDKAGRSQQGTDSPDLPSYPSFRGVRSLKHKADKDYKEGLRKSASLHDLSSQDKVTATSLRSSRFRSCSGDGLDIIDNDGEREETSHPGLSSDSEFCIPQYSCPAGLPPDSSSDSAPVRFTLSNSSSSLSSTCSAGSATARSLEERSGSTSRSKTKDPALQSLRDASVKEVPGPSPVPREAGGAEVGERRVGSSGSSLRQEADNLSQSMSADETDSNETDELKDLAYMKKGWLVKQGSSDKESQKHWFVLAGNALCYYRDAKAEENNALDGRIDLSTCSEVSEVNMTRNYGLKIKTSNGEYSLAAMTAGIRSNWMKALRLCMDLHSANPTIPALASTLASKTLAGLVTRTTEDSNTAAGASASTARTTTATGTKGEVAFQLVGRRDPAKKENKNVKRPQSDANGGDGPKTPSQTTITSDTESKTKPESSPGSSKAQRYSSSSAESVSQGGGYPLKRYVEGSDSVVPAPVQHTKEEEKRETTQLAKSPSSRAKEKSHSVKSPRVHSPALSDNRSAGSGQGDPPPAMSDEENVLNTTISSEENYHSSGDPENHEDSRSDSLGEGSIMVELLESEVESLRERLDHTQSELVKMHETNMDLKTRLQKEAAQVTEGHSGRWSQQAGQPADTAQTMKRQLKESRDTVQKQRIEIESLRAKLDMSVSKLTGTEKALSEALRDYKQEKDKFLKMSSEWNRRIRTLEGQAKDSTHKQERTRESLLNKERECRRLETEAKHHQQRTREQDREILKLKAVEKDYNQLKEQLDNRDRDLHNAHAQLHDKDSLMDNVRAELEQQIIDMEAEFNQERDALENHLEELKQRCHNAEEQQSSMARNMTSSLADLLKDKDDIIAQLEEKVIEQDTKMVDMQEELQAEMGENSDLTQDLENLQEEKNKLEERIVSMETQNTALKAQIIDLEKNSASLKQNLDKAQQENDKLSARLNKTLPSSDPEKVELEKTVQDLNQQIQGLQLQMMEKLEDLDSTSTHSEHSNALHLSLESGLKDITQMLAHLQTQFKTHVSSLEGDPKQEASSLAKAVDDLSEKCSLLQNAVQGSSHTPASGDSGGSDYHHTITVSASCSSSEVLEEYRSLQKKFERVVGEAKKLKKEVNEAHASYADLEKKERGLQETASNMEKSYGAQVKDLQQRVDTLTQQLSKQTADLPLPVKSSSNTSSAQQGTDTDHMLKQLDDRIQALEQILSRVPPTHLSSRTVGHSSSAESAQERPAVLSKLGEMCRQLDNISRDLKVALKDLPESEKVQGGPQSLVSRLDECSGNLSRLAGKSREGGSVFRGSVVSRQKEGGSVESHEKEGVSVRGVGVSSMGQCLHTIMDRLQEVGEQLDCLDDDDSDDEAEATSIEEVRDHLASLCEFVQQHSTLSDFDWRVMQLLSAQKAVLSKDKIQAGGLQSANNANKLQAYADRLSLEAVILVEMAHLLENKKGEDRTDRVLQEIAMMNSKVLCLHQKLEQQMNTMSVRDVSADVLRVQADLLAEKIMVEGHVCSSALSASQGSIEGASEKDRPQSEQAELLAAEALTRSQLDSYIGNNLDSNGDELWTSASHLTTRSMVQGELTFALHSLKRQLSDRAGEPQSASCVRDLYLQRLKDRHKAVMEVAKVYQQRMTQAFATIIFRESEDLTLMEGTGSVLDTVCSEISSIMENHIQQCKAKVRTAQHTPTAHRWDMMVSQLREDRESILAEIRRQHSLCAQDCDTKLDFPSQSLDNSISSFGEIMALCAMLSAHLNFLLEQLKLGDSGLLGGMEEEEEEEEEEEGEESQRRLRERLCSFVHSLAEALQEQAENRSQEQFTLTDKNDTAASIPSIPHPKTSSPYSDALAREAVFAAQTTFLMFKLKLLHQQEMEALRISHPVRRHRPRQPLTDSEDANKDVNQTLIPLGGVVEASHNDEMEALRVISSQVDKLKGIVGGREWQVVEKQVQQLQRKVEEEVKLAEQRHQEHITLFKEEQKKIEELLEECQQERNHLEERCATLEVDLHSISHQHDDEVERMRQDVLTAVSAIRANEGQSDTQLSDRLQLLTKQISLQKDMYLRFLEQLKSQVLGSSKDILLELVDRQLKDITNNTPQVEGDAVSVVTPPPPTTPHPEDKALKMEEELELLKKEKDEALAEETRNTKAALDAMRKAYEEELQQERAKYRDCVLTMYNEDLVEEIRQRHRAEVEKTREELKQAKAQYLSKCEDLKLLEVRMGQTKQDYEAHISQLLTSNSHLDEMVTEQIDRLKGGGVRKRTSSQSSATATMEEELYDAQITIRVKDTELQKLRSQVKNFEDSLHRTTEEHKQTMTQYLQALKENQELRKEYHAETLALQEQLDKALGDSGLRKTVKRAPSFHRTRSPSPAGATSQRRDCASTSEHVSQDCDQRKPADQKDLRRSKSSPSLSLIFNAKGVAPTMKLPPKRDRRLSQRL